MIERWKDVKGFEGLYKVSNFGNIMHKSKGAWKILKNTNSKGDYLSVKLKSNNGSIKYTRIHRIVAETFIPNPLNLPQVNHIDMNKQNNRVDNLEWCSHRENIKKAIELKPSIILGIIKYNKFERPKKIFQYSLEGEYIDCYNTAVEAQQKTGVCKRNILQCANKEPFNKNGGIRKQAGGFVWTFEKKEVVK